MLSQGPAKKVTIYLNEDTSNQTGFIYERVFSFLLERGVAGATLIRPQEGFGSHHLRHSREEHGAHGIHLPVRIEFIESAEAVESLLPTLRELVKDGLIDAHDTSIVWMAKQESAF